jgi:hypothetical protein
MKTVTIFSLILFCGYSFAFSGWKMVARSTSCSDQIRIMAKEGETYVIAQKGAEKIKLFSEDKISFKSNLPWSSQFTAKSGKMGYRLIYPSSIEANPPKLDIYHGKKFERCKLEII